MPNNIFVGQIVIVFNKKGRGYNRSIELGTVKAMTAEGGFELFDGRVFSPEVNKQIGHVTYWNRDTKFGTMARAPFWWRETYASVMDMADELTS